MGFCACGCWFWFFYIKLSWDTGSADCISSKKKTEHLTNIVFHFSGLVSSLTLGFSISGYRVFVNCPSKKHPIMLII